MRRRSRKNLEYASLRLVRIIATRVRNISRGFGCDATQSALRQQSVRSKRQGHFTVRAGTALACGLAPLHIAQGQMNLTVVHAGAQPGLLSKCRMNDARKVVPT